MYPPAPKPATKLGVYRRLSSNAGVHVSPLQLGAMSVGENKWDQFFGKTDKESSYKLLDTYFNSGGNFIDTSSNYQEGSSEECIGEWAEERGIRDQLFIATKYSTISRDGSPIKQRVLYSGNSAKSLRLSFEISLKRLRTNYIDLFYLHWWDYETSVEEVMHALHHLVAAGKVLYLGISDAPAWVVTKANQYARDHGLTPFSVYQGKWSVLARDFEREIIPMARSEGLALAPWGALGSGKLMTDAEEEAKGKRGDTRGVYGDNWKRTEHERNVSAALEKVAKEVGSKHITAVALAYLLQKLPYVFPIVGGRKPEQLLANLEALNITLTEGQIQCIESASPIDLGFPTDFIGNGSAHIFLANTAGRLKKPLLLQAHRPEKTDDEEVQQ